MRPARSVAGECPERQRGRTVNPLAYAFVGSSPTSPTSSQQLEIKYKVHFGHFPEWPFSCRNMLRFVRVYFPAFPGFPENFRQLHATCLRHEKLALYRLHAGGNRIAAA